MTLLARKTLLYEWRRFLPAALAVAFSGLLLIAQSALVAGIFSSASVYIRASHGDLWVGKPGTQSIELGRPIAHDVEMPLALHPGVARVEAFDWIGADWRGPADKGGISVFVSGIDVRADGLAFAAVLPTELRARLAEPSAVVVDRADLEKLGVAIGDSASINGVRVRIVGTAQGLRALGGVNVVASLATARRLDLDAENAGKVAYYLIALDAPARAESIRDALNARAAGADYEVWTRDEFARRAVRYWMFETGAGLGVIFLALVVALVGAVITSQSLMAAVAGSLREYATLRALGVGAGGLRAVVLEQAAWIGGVGLVLGAAAALLLLALARAHDVPVALDPPGAAACAALVMGIALASGLAALRTLRRADPADLLR